jgi:hypothetical protein
MDASLIPRRVVIEVFKKYHSGTTEDYIHGGFEEFERMVVSDSLSWDKLNPRKFVLDVPT